MPKISKNASTVLSMILACFFMAGIVAGAILLPHLIDFLTVNSCGFIVHDFTAGGKIFITVAGYIVLAVAAVADVFLLLLLKSIRKGEIFTSACVALIRRISWCLFLVGIIFIPLGFFFLSAWIVAFAGIFLGLCIRVVKNAFEEAVYLKEENDLTV